MGKFGETLEATRLERGDSQGEIADYVNDWLETKDLDYELAELERTATRQRREELAPVIQVIRDARRRRPPAVCSASQAAVSKWRLGANMPTEEKWLALADYLTLPVNEVYDMIMQDAEPRTAIKLRAQLAAAVAENEVLRRQNAEQEERLARAERALRLTERDLALQYDRITDLEHTVEAEARADVHLDGAEHDGAEHAHAGC